MRLCIEDAEAVISCPWMLGNARFGACGAAGHCALYMESERRFALRRWMVSPMFR